jgi:hypothetical protein
MNIAEQERAAIVAYLRETEIIHKSWAKFYGTTKGKHDWHAEACKYAADAIQNGAHLVPHSGESPPV